MTFFTASIETSALRFFLMMAIIIIALFSSFPILGVLALPVFLAALTGVSFNKQPKTKTASFPLSKTSTKKMNTAA